MENELQNTRNVNCKIAIIIFAIISIFFTCLGNIFTFAYWTTDLFNRFIFRDLIYIFLELIDMVVVVLPCVILVVYSLFFYKKLTAKYVITAVYLLLSIPAILGIINLLMIFAENFYHGWQNILNITLERLIFYILPFVPFLLGAVLTLFGVRNKFLHIIPFVLMPIYIISTIFNYAVNLRYFIESFDVFWSNVLGTPLIIIGETAMYIMVFSFIMLNNHLILKNTNYIKVNDDIKNLTPEKALIMLKSKLDNGDITKEEYQAQREIVINKL